MDKTKIMEYLYGEMDASQVQAFEARIKEDPTLRDEVEQMQGLQSFLSDHEDEQPSGRALILPTRQNSIWKSKWWAAAAAMILLLAAGKVLDLKIFAANGQIAIQYGDHEDQEQNQDHYLELINQLASNFDKLSNDMVNRMDDNQQLIEANSNHIGQYQADMKNLVKNLTNDQRKMTRDLWQEFKDDQQKHTEVLVDDFVEFVDLQRQHDLQMINESINTLSQLMQMEIEQRAQYVYQPVQK